MYVYRHVQTKPCSLCFERKPVDVGWGTTCGVSLSYISASLPTSLESPNLCSRTKSYRPILMKTDAHMYKRYLLIMRHWGGGAQT